MPRFNQIVAAYRANALLFTDLSRPERLKWRKKREFREITPSQRLKWQMEPDLLELSRSQRLKWRLEPDLRELSRSQRFKRKNTSIQEVSAQSNQL
ncbi:hypothetical protein SD71_21245 [Cohnella kolymensis]|uniref:Uncharacterized protein n=1 Tax=Cohnella kolymensis TaxID=1590652 RepID=A0ABR4ZZT3_9BACL|nr:hypothetical protein [Cohnella kolymensis]KIL34192.1 hypothetical protein SD71_21245 [Cohnella kolymensis]